MISLKSLEIHHFRSFVSTPKIEFPKHGLVLLRALPFNGSSSGVGKSNFLKAISYATTTGLVRDNTKHWFSDESDRLSVAEEFYVGEKVFKVVRGPFKTELYIDGVKQEGGAKAINERLAKTFGLDFDLVELLTVRRQRKQNSFVASGDADKKEFLSRILGLSDIDDLIKTSNDTIKKIEVLIEQERITIVGFEEDIQKLVKPVSPNNNEIEFLTIKLNQYIDLLAKAKVELDLKEHAKLSLEQLKANRVSKLNDVSLIKQELGFKVVLETLPHVQEMSVKKDKRTTLLEKCKDKPVLIAQNKTLETKLNILKTSICSECQRPWGEALTKAQEYDYTIKSNQNRLQEIICFESDIVLLDKEIKVLEDTIASLKKVFDLEITKLNLDFTSRNSLIDNEYAKQIGDLHIDKIKEGISELNELISDLKSKLKDLNHCQEIYEVELKNYTNHFENLSVKATKGRLNIEKMMRVMALEEDFKDLIGRKGFLGIIIAEILTEISYNVNKILSQVPNTTEISIIISPTQEKENSVKPKIDMGFYKRGFAVEYDDLSGGQKASLELAMDLAMSNVIFRRMNVDLGWSIFDESFHGLDSVDKEAYFEILKRESENKLIFIVDHDVKFQNYFDKILTLAYDGQQTIVQE